jgi:hypothetical protein
MNALLSYQFEEAPVRVVMIADDPWFVANDISKVLGYGQAAFMTRHLDDDEKGLHIVQTLGGAQEMNIISESGLYAAIFKSRRPEARRFRKWVTSEVLPTIRRTGKFELDLPPELDRPSDYDPHRLSVGVQVVREARRLYGPAAARRLWTQVGLPPAVAETAPAEPSEPIAEALKEWLGDRQAVTVAEAADGLGLSTELDRSLRLRIGGLLTLFGWPKRKVRRGAGTVWMWFRPGTPGLPSSEEEQA